MTNIITQARLPKGLIDQIDNLIEKGMYISKSDFIREAVRELLLKNQIGSIQNQNNSVSEIRNIRNELSKKNIKLKELNTL